MTCLRLIAVSRQIATTTRPAFTGCSTKLVGACYLVQWDNLGDLKTAPSRLKCLIDSASGFDLCVSRNIVAADKESGASISSVR
jgi:hypothetical protein